MCCMRERRHCKLLINERNKTVTVDKAIPFIISFVCVNQRECCLLTQYARARKKRQDENKAKCSLCISLAPHVSYAQISFFSRHLDNTLSCLFSISLMRKSVCMLHLDRCICSAGADTPAGVCLLAGSMHTVATCSKMNGHLNWRTESVH